MNTIAHPTKEQLQLFARFYNDAPATVQIIDTGHGEDDLRQVLIGSFADGEKRIVKLAANDFTDAAHIAAWQRTAREYRQLGCWCPQIFADRAGEFPTVELNGQRYVAYGEEFSPYRSADAFALTEPQTAAYQNAAWLLTARVAAAGFDYTDFPSAYCLYDTFAPCDETDEVLANALDWKAFANTLPATLQPQVQRIWQLWQQNRAALEPLYRQLPTSVFQADLNPTNVLLDEAGNFTGLYDFNCSGREVFLNYLFRESYCADFAAEVELLRQRLRLVRESYTFSPLEKAAALPLYRCLKPLWFNKRLRLKQLAADPAALQNWLDQTEHALTADIDLAREM